MRNQIKDWQRRVDDFMLRWLTQMLPNYQSFLMCGVAAWVASATGSAGYGIMTVLAVDLVWELGALVWAESDDGE